MYGNWVNLTLTMTAPPLDNYCWDPLTPIRLFDASLSLEGRRRPDERREIPARRSAR